MFYRLFFVVAFAAASVSAQSFPAAYEFLPEDFISITVSKYGETAPGYYYAGLYKRGYNTPYYMTVFDENGTPIHYRRVVAQDFKYHPSQERFGFFAVTDAGNFRMGNFYVTDKRFRIDRVVDASPGDGRDSHESLFEPDGDLLILGKEYDTVDMTHYVSGGDTTARVIDVCVYRVDTAGVAERVWKPSDHVAYTDSEIDLTQHTLDYIHTNAIAFDDDAWLLSHRHLSEITKVDTTTGEIVWRWGGSQNEFEFVDDSIGFSYQHMIRKTPDGTYTLFDNGNNHTPAFSRGLEYELDEDSATATLVREFLVDPRLYSVAMSSTQRLPNGSTLLGFSHNSRAYEFDETGAEVLSISFSPAQTLFYRIFKHAVPNHAFVAEGETPSRDTLRFDHDGDVDTLALANALSHDLVVNAVFSRTGSYSAVDSLPLIVPPGETRPLRVRFDYPGFQAPPSEALYVAAYDDTVGYAKDYVAVADAPSGAANDAPPVSDFLIASAFPNPFNSATMLEYRLDEPADVVVEVYSLLGEKIYERRTRDLAGVRRVRLDFSRRSAGVYAISVTAVAGEKRRREIVKALHLK